MPKPRKTLHVQLPSRQGSRRLAWRKDILHVLQKAVQRRGIVYDKADRLSLSIRVYLVDLKLDRIDVDNVLKDVMDGLQGQLGGYGKKVMKPRARIIWNDRQVWRVTIEKVERPPKLKGTAGGHLTISRL